MKLMRSLTNFQDQKLGKARKLKKQRQDNGQLVRSWNASAPHGAKTLTKSMLNSNDTPIVCSRNKRKDPNVALVRLQLDAVKI